MCSIVMSSFHERQKSLFNHLKDAEEQCNFSKTNKAPVPQDFGVIDRHTYRKLKHEMKQFRGRESIFKRPEANIRECLRAKTIPDYIKNPQKWVYYSLSDVTPDQMSDATNTATALAHIRELEEREASKRMNDGVNDNDLVFKKPTFHISSAVKKIAPKRDMDNITFKSNKVIMPEYVVGVSKKKENKPKVARRISQSDIEDVKKAELKLDHLYTDGEE